MSLIPKGFRVTKIVKRDGRIVDFDPSRIENAIKKAMLHVKQYDPKTLKKVVSYVLKVINEKFNEENIPHVEQVQDIVELALVKFDLYEVAKAYILYRKEREKIREEKKRLLEKDYVDEVDKSLSLNAIRLLASRYLLRDEHGRLIEDPKKMFTRVAALIVIPDILYDPKIFDKEGSQKPYEKEPFKPEDWEGKVGLEMREGKPSFTWNRYHLERMKSLYDELNSQGKMRVSWSRFWNMLLEGEFDHHYEDFENYYRLMVEKKFLPNSPTLFNAGARLGQLSACFVLDIEDDINSIMDVAKEVAIIFKCVDGSEHIMTSKGLVPIGEVGDLLKRANPHLNVLTDLGAVPIGLVHDNGSDEVLEIETEYGYKIRVTPEHWIVVADYDGLKWRRAGEIRAGDWVPIVLGSWIVEDEYSFKHIGIHSRADPSKGCSTSKRVRLPEKLDVKLAELVGLYLGGGSICRDGIRMISGTNGEEYVKIVSKLVEEVFNVKPSIRRRGENGTYEVNIPSILVKEFLVDIGLIKPSSKELRVPEPILRSSEKVVAAFLRGLFTANGTVDRGRYVQLRTSSRTLAEQLQTVLLHLGIPSRLYSTNKGYIVRITGKKGILRFKEKIGFLTTSKNSKLLKINLDKDYTSGEKLPHITSALSKLYESTRDKRVKRILTDYIPRESKPPRRVPSRRLLLRLKNILGYLPEVLEEALNSEVTFTRVKSVKKLGVRRVYDIYVPRVNRYLLKGFISHNSGGGVGINYSKLRPEGDIVRSTSGIASGPVSFMKIIDTVTDVIKQGGKRRGANMGILEVWHPDIEKFITCKSKEGQFTNFNISVMFTEDFWRYYEEGKLYPLMNPRDRKVWKEIDPRALFHMVAENAWRSGDPGVLFLDNINRRNILLKAKGPIRATNPCGEQPLYPYGSCNLGSINLYAFIRREGEKTWFDWEEFRKTVRLSLRFLDNVIDVNVFPLEKIEKETKETRKVGLGLMGLADALYALNIRYNSEEGFKFMREIAENLSYYSMLESVERAKERGAFPLYEKSSYINGDMPFEGFYHRDLWTLDWDWLSNQIRKYGIRNVETTSIAPTGSISMIFDVSSGIEPQFALVYEKRVTVGTFYYVDVEFERQLKERGLYSEELLKKVAENGGSIQELEEIPKDMREVFVVAYDIPWWDHIRAQYEIQLWISSAVSKTINMPHWITVDDVQRAYLFAYKLGLKGLTIYREGSKSVQVLVTPSQRRGEYVTPAYNKTLDLMRSLGIEPPALKSREAEEVEKPTLPRDRRFRLEPKPKGKIPERIENCPECGSKNLVYMEGCVSCLDCGWSACLVG